MQLDVGEVRKAKELGYKGRGSYIGHACIDCGKERWVQAVRGKPRVAGRCLLCAMRTEQERNRRRERRGEKSPLWKGGRVISPQGYVFVLLQPDDPFYSMVDRRNYVLEHRLIIARELGRPLLRTEQVHHIDGIKDHNARSNLMLISPLDHSIYTKLCVNCNLQKEVRLLKWQVRELAKQLQGRLICN